MCVQLPFCFFEQNALKFFGFVSKHFFQIEKTDGWIFGFSYFPECEKTGGGIFGGDFLRFQKMLLDFLA